ncbi:MAG: hypothetical protein NTV46_00910 [Verrucomicrobia bacterium]|nr:hypothetical protein [Verrucomicrobiota bacterium]
MTQDNAIALIAPCITAVLGYYFGSRSERLRMRRERRSESTSSLVKLIGAAVTQLRMELASERGDDFESSEKTFQHLSFLAELRASYDVGRQTLTEEVEQSVEELLDALRRYSHMRLMLASKSLTCTELNWPMPIEDLLIRAINALKSLEMHNT